MSGADYIESLELMGMQFGLERMHALMEALGHPEQRFDAIHIVGSNGKSSTVRFCEALLEAEGVATGAYTSPHITTFRERIRIGGETISAEGYERAVSAVRDTGIEVTQFEALTAAAYVAFAAAGVQVAVVEAGLGGRLDATNVLARSRVQVLTNVSLEHSELLGQTRERIAAEKLAVVPEGGDLVIGEAGWEDAAPQAARTKVVTVGGSYQDQNRAVARAAVETLLGRPVDPSPIERLEVAGRLEVRGQPSARDLGRRPQPGRHAAAGRGAAGAARRPRRRWPCSRRWPTRTSRRWCRCCGRCARPSSPPPPATRDRFRPTPWRRWPADRPAIGRRRRSRPRGCWPGRAAPSSCAGRCTCCTISAVMHPTEPLRSDRTAT